MVKNSGLKYVVLLLVMVWLCSASYAAALPLTLPLTLPSDRQCQTLLAQEFAQGLMENKPVIKAQIKGWCLIITRSKGNCLACHHIDVASSPEGLSAPGNIAPVLANIAKRFPNKIELKNIIYNAASRNPHTFMPLFGKHKILTETEIDRIVDFLMTL